MAANVVEVDGTVGDGASTLTVARQVLGGAAMEELELSAGGGAVAVLTVAGHACDPQPVDQATSPEVVALDVAVDDADLRARVVRTEPGEPDESGGLKSAKVVVGAGRGAGSPDGFKDLLELTELLDGALGVSRVVTSLGWRPHHEQVGQTGSRVSPDLYVACGISGAIQHWAGMSSSKTILAINSDPDAPMVTKAHYAVIGDLHEIVPAVNEELRRRRSA
jgi:electron transfer flavoprotein alpha subunit